MPTGLIVAIIIGIIMIPITLFLLLGLADIGFYIYKRIKRLLNERKTMGTEVPSSKD